MKLKFRSKLLIPVIVAVVASFLITSISIYTVVYKETKVLATENAWNLSSSLGIPIKSRFERAVKVVQGLVETSTVMVGSGTINRQVAVDYLRGVIKDNPEITGIYVAWEPNAFDGEDAEAIKQNEVGTHKSGRFAPFITQLGGEITTGSVEDFDGDWYTKSLEMGKVQIFNPERFDVEGKSVQLVSVTSPVYINGKLMGVAGIDINIDDIGVQLAKAKVYDNGYAFLFTNDMITIAHPKKENIGKPSTVAAQLKVYADRDERYFVDKTSGVTKKRAFTFYTPIKITGTDYAFYFGLAVPYNEIFEQLATIRLLIIVVALISVLLITGVIFIVVGKMMRQLGGEPDYVVSTVNEIASGDFTIRLDVKSNKDSLVYSVNNMVEGLSRMIKNSGEVSTKLKASSQALAHDTQQLTTNTEEQAQRSEQISSAAVEMNAVTHEIARNLVEISSFSQETQNVATQGQQSVVNAIKEIAKIKDAVDEAMVLITKLAGKSVQIKNIVSVITNVADQTNLLALNAAIEAARAGDAGRGFAVVADEVRKLAENTQKATSEISQLVVENQKETDSVTKYMESMLDQVNVGVDSSKEITLVLDEIRSGVSKLHVMVDSMTAATDQMTVTTGQVQKDLDQMAHASRDVRATTGHLSEKASELELVSNDLDKMMQKFKV